VSLLLRSVKITKFYSKLRNTCLNLPFSKSTLVIDGSAPIYTFISGLKDEMDNLLCVKYNIFCSQNKTFWNTRCLRITVSLWVRRMCTLNFICICRGNSFSVWTVYYYRHGPRTFPSLFVKLILKTVTYSVQFSYLFIATRLHISVPYEREWCWRAYFIVY